MSSQSLQRSSSMLRVAKPAGVAWGPILPLMATVVIYSLGGWLTPASGQNASGQNVSGQNVSGQGIKLEQGIKRELDAQWKHFGPRPNASFRAVSVVDQKTVWVGGSNGVVLRSNDGGKSFDRIRVPLNKADKGKSDERQFRDIHAFDRHRVSLMNAGEPATLYYTSDGGQSWAVAFHTDDKGAFFNGIDFWNQQRGIGFSDAVKGRLLIITTKDGGKSWKRLPFNQCPVVKESEHGYAASGTSIITAPGGRVWIGLGGDPGKGKARILYSPDYGEHWTSLTSTLNASESGGVFSLFCIGKRGVAVGGDYRRESSADSVLSLSNDSGRTWKEPVGEHGLRGFRSALAAGRLGDRTILFAVGPSGCDVSTDQGSRWHPLSKEGFHAMDASPMGDTIWAVGSAGRIARLEFSQRR